MLFELCEPRRGKFSDNKMVRRGEKEEGREGRREMVVEEVEEVVLNNM